MKKKINAAHKNKNSSQDPAKLRKRTERALRKSEKYFKEILDKFSDIIIITDKAGYVKYCSLSVERFIGYKPEEVTGKNMLTFIHKDDIKRAVNDFSKSILADENNIIPNTFRIVHKNGQEIYSDGLGRNLLNNPDIAGFVMNVRDITESKNMEEKYRNILENIQEGYFEVDLAGNFTFFNDSICRILGYPEKELTDMNNRQYTDKDIVRKVFQAFNQVYKTGKPRNEIDWQITRKDGTKVCVEASISLRKDSSGKPVGFRGILRDITERKRAEEKLLFEGQRFRALADHSSDIILFLDPKGTITYINPAVEKILGYKVAERIGASALETMHPDDIKYALDKLKILATDTNSPVLQMEMRLKDKVGSWHIVETLGSNLVKDDAVKAIIIRQHDITERKQAESQREAALENLRKSEANYRQLFDNAPAGIYRIDYKNGRFLKANDVCCEYYGCSQEEIPSLNAYDVLTEESKKLFSERVEKISQGMKVPEVVEFELLNKKGKIICLQLHTKNIYDAEGHAIAADVVAHDITERKKAEEELKRFAENLEDANIALRVLMNNRNEDQKQIEKKLQVNINDLVIPYLEKLNKANLDDRNKNYLSVLETNLKDVLSPFMRDFRSSHKKLTPQEIQIVDLIMKGKNTKEISEMLNASVSTIFTHRNNIRKKMNLINAKINLRSYLLSPQ